MSKNCEIIKDLLPLYADDVCSEESRKLVAEHIAKCSECRAELEKMGIKYKRIRIATPRHNGKVERQHRTDEKRFYKKMRMYSLEDGRKQLTRYNRQSNNTVKICLDFKSPNEKLKEYLAQPSANLDSSVC